MILTIKFEVFLACVCNETSKVGAVIPENEISVFNLFGHSAIDKLARRFTARPGVNVINIR